MLSFISTSCAHFNSLTPNPSPAGAGEGNGRARTNSGLTGFVLSRGRARSAAPEAHMRIDNQRRSDNFEDRGSRCGRRRRIRSARATGTVPLPRHPRHDRRRASARGRVLLRPGQPASAIFGARCGRQPHKAPAKSAQRKRKRATSRARCWARPKMCGRRNSVRTACRTMAARPAPTSPPPSRCSPTTCRPNAATRHRPLGRSTAPQTASSTSTRASIRPWPIG